MEDICLHLMIRKSKTDESLKILLPHKSLSVDGEDKDTILKIVNNTSHLFLSSSTASCDVFKNALLIEDIRDKALKDFISPTVNGWFESLNAIKHTLIKSLNSPYVALDLTTEIVNKLNRLADKPLDWRDRYIYLRKILALIASRLTQSNSINEIKDENTCYQLIALITEKLTKDDI